MTDLAIQEIARAAYIAHHKSGPTEDALDEPNMGRGGFKTEVLVWEAVADAAIAAMVEAMREPSEAMQLAGCDVLVCNKEKSWAKAAANTWQAMLTAFLQEQAAHTDGE